MPTMADGWVETVAQITGLPEEPVYGARLLWMRGVRSPKALRGFWQAADYTPASPFEFGEEMTWAVERLLLASALKKSPFGVTLTPMALPLRLCFGTASSSFLLAQISSLTSSRTVYENPMACR